MVGSGRQRVAAFINICCKIYQGDFLFESRQTWVDRLSAIVISICYKYKWACYLCPW
jgi:hypothetical protein